MFSASVDLVGDSKLGYYRSAMLRSLSDDKCEYLNDAIIVTHQNGSFKGQIIAVGIASEVAKNLHLRLSDIPKRPGLLMPAFFDTHFHWVQDDVRMMPKISLIKWLELYTFPEEAKYQNREYARYKAQRFWKRILSVGTIGGLCYSSIHETALEAAFKYAPEDFYIGNVLMTMNCPQNLRQSVLEAALSVYNCSAKYKRRYVCSPRFAPTTCPKTMLAAVEAACLNDCFLQTHLSETLNEIDWVLNIYKKFKNFKTVKTYTEIYDRVKLLGPKTVFGHCLHLHESEWELLANSCSSIACCPTSNAPVEDLGIGSGLFDYKKADSEGVSWSLASDIGGGPFLSMFDVMKSFVSQNCACGHNTTYAKALYRSTFMGAKIMKLSKDRGMLAEGYYLDAIYVPLPDQIPCDASGETVLKKLINSITDRHETDNMVIETIIKGTTCFKKGDPL